MKNVTKLFSMVIMISSSPILEVDAQSYVTYNHDAAKMNQKPFRRLEPVV